MTDNETDRALRLTVGVVVAVGAAVVVWAVAGIPPPPSFLYPVIATALIAVAGMCLVGVQIRAQHMINTTDAAVLISVALLPWPWAVVCTAAGSSIAMVALRKPPIKAAFNSAKDTIATAAASAAFVAVGAVPLTTTTQPQRWITYLGALCVAAVAFATVEKPLVTPVVALATRTPWRRVLTRDLDLSFAIRGANLLVAGVAVALYLADPLLLAAAPFGLAFVYLAYRHRMHLREERRAWQQLAAATDALGSAGLDEVLHTAIRGAATLFPDLEIEVELLADSTRRVVRGGQTGITYDGDPAGAPVARGPTLAVPLEADPGATGPLGVLRLRFRVEVKLSDHERCMLTTFAAGLSTAIRNAAAYAELARLAERHAHEAAHDSLTGLPNRRQLHERMTAALAAVPRAGVVALMLLDLDHFKEVNDTLGHGAGDQVLVEVAERLRVGAGDALVARLGGDEFAVLFTGLATPAVAPSRARRVLDQLRAPIELDGVLVDPQSSAGLAVAGDTTDAVELLRRADVAMYQAKDSGRQVTVYARNRDSADRGRLALAGELPRAVEGQEFTVEFQPIADLASGTVIAAEALARWRHPDQGHLPPAAFLGLIERSGLLAAFTEAVLHRSLAAAADWHAAGFNLRVAVNLSPRSLGDPGLAKMVLHALDEYQVDPHRLTLEVTETAAINYIDIVERSVARLREAGVRFALDDFGTGQSSLAAVLHLPVDQLKIDRSFVAALRNCSRSRALVCGTIEVGRQLGATVVAEGIEHPYQRRDLWELGCTAGQGSLFGWPPLPSHELLATLREGHEGVPGTVAAGLHPDATVVRLPRQTPRADTPQAGHQ